MYKIREGKSVPQILEECTAILEDDPDWRPRVLSIEQQKQLLHIAKNFFKLDCEAAQHVESVICMRTDFTGDEPYVGWKGLGLALKEALDERDHMHTMLSMSLDTLERISMHYGKAVHGSPEKLLESACGMAKYLLQHFEQSNPRLYKKFQDEPAMHD